MASLFARAGPSETYCRYQSRLHGQAKISFSVRHVNYIAGVWGGGGGARKRPGDLFSPSPSFNVGLTLRIDEVALHFTVSASRRTRREALAPSRSAVLLTFTHRRCESGLLIKSGCSKPVRRTQTRPRQTFAN